MRSAGIVDASCTVGGSGRAFTPFRTWLWCCNGIHRITTIRAAKSFIGYIMITFGAFYESYLITVLFLEINFELFSDCFIII